MKKQLLLIAFALLSIGCMHAQSLYNGGSGDGFDHEDIIYITGDPAPQPLAEVYPTSLASGDEFRIRVSDLRNKVQVVIYDMRGIELRRVTDWPGLSEYTLQFGTEGWAAGMYLLDIRLDGRRVPERLFLSPAE